MINAVQYYMGRDVSHFNELTDEIRRNAETTVRLVNELLAEAAREGIKPGVAGLGGQVITSGWRPASLNRCTEGAAPGSKHILGLACDLFDTVNSDLARWCLRNPGVLERIGLWMEDPRWTPTWVHLQIVPPHSGRRIYIPSSAPPKRAPLPEQEIKP